MSQTANLNRSGMFILNLILIVTMDNIRMIEFIYEMNLLVYIKFIKTLITVLFVLG